MRSRARHIKRVFFRGDRVRLLHRVHIVRTAGQRDTPCLLRPHVGTRQAERKRHRGVVRIDAFHDDLARHPVPAGHEIGACRLSVRQQPVEEQPAVEPGTHTFTIKLDLDRVPASGLDGTGLAGNRILPVLLDAVLLVAPTAKVQVNRLVALVADADDETFLADSLRALRSRV